MPQGNFAVAFRLRVLLVDDEIRFCRLLKAALEQTGRYVVETENRPTHALQKALEFRPQVVLMDVMMPEMDGGELAALFKANPRLGATPIVFLTAAVKRAELSAHSGEVGGCRFLAKPVALHEVMACLDQYGSS